MFGNTDTSQKFSKEERRTLGQFRGEVQRKENEQADDLMLNCKNKYQFAKTYSVYIRDWDKTKQQMLETAHSGKFPVGLNKEMIEEMVRIGDEVIKGKLAKLEMFFQLKWREPIQNYLVLNPESKKLLKGLAIFAIVLVLALILIISFG